MLSAPIRDLVRSTAPLLQTHGETLTRHFYARLFEHQPELRAVFNQGHQRSGQQQQALAGAVAAYAAHIDDPTPLAPVLERIAHKHVSLGIRAEHYGVVGRHLLASIAEVLGPDLATPELIEAWRQAYGQLAEVLVNAENKLYAQAVSQDGGWSGWRRFRIDATHLESSEVRSFVLSPQDGGAVCAHLPGQYVSVRLTVDEGRLQQARQYSLSQATNGRTLRISVKREDAVGHDGNEASGIQPAGMVSNALHANHQVGDVVEVAPPMGEFVLHTDRSTPVVLLSAGIGVTPIRAMLEHLGRHQPQRHVWALHAARDRACLALHGEVTALLRELPHAHQRTHLEALDSASADEGMLSGRMDLSALARSLPLVDADFYLCGPLGFMRAQMRSLRELGVPASRIHAEAFGTGGV